MPLEPNSKTSAFVYGGLAAVWLLIAGWLALEHAHTTRLAHNAMLNRARDITNTIGLASRAGPPGFIRQSRLDAVLNELIRTTELISVALLNAKGDVVATAGEPFRADINQLPNQGAQWNDQTVTVVNLVDFGQSTQSDGTVRSPMVVIPQSEEDSPGRGRFFRSPEDDLTTGGRRSGRRRSSLPEESGPNTRSGESPGKKASESSYALAIPPASPASSASSASPENMAPPDGGGPPPPGGMIPLGEGMMPPSAPGVMEPPAPLPRPPSRRVFHRPSWMDPKRYEELLAKRGLHGFVLVMSTDKMRAEESRDFWLRMTIAGAALAAVIALGLAWRGLVRSTQLRIRLVRAQEMNERLREMNLAAAGLAHEARNPLNIVRGAAQLIDKQEEQVPEGVRKQARQITMEVDRITQRLNEFIKYSRPMQPRMAATPVAAVVADVLGALQSDLDDKKVIAETNVPDRNIRADESLLRQVVFNLLLNAIQAVPQGGRVLVSLSIPPRGEGVLSIEDNGPGVPPDQREQIFSPYFTTHEEGSGLGLAVVRQIVLAHQWGVECMNSAMGGAAFRISGLKIMENEDKAQA